MAISPPSDIVMDVMLSADPQRVAAATGRLQAGAVPASAQFTTVLSGMAALSPPPSAAALSAQSSESLRRAAGPGPAGGVSKAGFELEALLLGNFISRLLPSDSAAVMGGGQAAEMWKSLLSEKIAYQIAKTGKLGIAARLSSSGALASGQTARGV